MGMLDLWWPWEPIPPVAEQSWFTKEEAAEYLRVSTRTLDRWVAGGRLHAYRKSRKLIRFRREDLDAFMTGEEANPRRAASNIQMSGRRSQKAGIK